MEDTLLQRFLGGRGYRGGDERALVCHARAAITQPVPAVTAAVTAFVTRILHPFRVHRGRDDRGEFGCEL